MMKVINYITALSLTLTVACNSNTDKLTEEELNDTGRLEVNETYRDKKNNDRDYTLSGTVEQDIFYLIPEGNISGDLMRVSYNKKYKDIALRLKNNANANKEWFDEYYKKGREAGEVIYDPKLGITEEEFRYMDEYKGEFIKIAELNLNVQIQNKDEIFIECKELPDFDSIRFVMKDYYVVLNNMACKYQGTFEVQDAAYPGGLKKGHFWRYENFGNGNQKIEQIYEVRVSEVKGTGDIMFYVGIHDIGPDKSIEREYVLIYPPLLKQ